MSLNWNLTKIKNHKELCWIPEGKTQRMNPITDMLIWTTMLVGMGAITAKTLDRFCQRVHLYQTLHGALLRKGDGTARPLARADIEAHVGLSTNVSTETNAKFRARMINVFDRDAHSLERRPVSFGVTFEEAGLICRIAMRMRTLEHGAGTRKSLQPYLMDLTACHANGVPLDLERLLAAPDGDFGHDVFGIRRYLDRSTGKLTNCFIPRCAR